MDRFCTFHCFTTNCCLSQQMRKPYDKFWNHCEHVKNCWTQIENIIIVTTYLIAFQLVREAWNQRNSSHTHRTPHRICSKRTTGNNMNKMLRTIQHKQRIICKLTILRAMIHLGPLPSILELLWFTKISAWCKHVQNDDGFWNNKKLITVCICKKVAIVADRFDCICFDERK